MELSELFYSGLQFRLRERDWFLGGMFTYRSILA